MASTTQKKTTTAKKSSSGKSGGRSQKPTQPQKRPIRREVGGFALLALTLCVLVSYFHISAIFIDWFAVLLKGLFGYGYWLAGPALLLSALILLFHHGRPVQLRVTCALLLPVLFGTLGQIVRMMLRDETYESSLGILAKLWTSGNEMASGGAVSGTLAIGSSAVFSPLVSLILFTVLFVVLLMVALRLTVGALIEKHRERPQYEEEPEPERPTIRLTPVEPPKRRTEEKPKPQIDFPLDDAPAKEPEPVQKEPGRFTSFFRHKSDQQRTPDQVLSEKPAEKTPAAPPPAISTPTAAPAPAPIPVQPEVPAPVPAAQELPASSRKEKATTAKEVAAQTAAVTAEIEEKLSGPEETY